MRWRRPSVEDSAPSQHMQSEAESHEIEVDQLNDEDKRRIDYDLHDLTCKYEEVVRRIRGSYMVDQLINATYLPYSVSVMNIPFPSHFKVSHIDVYDGSAKSMEYLENLKVHKTLR